MSYNNSTSISIASSAGTTTNHTVDLGAGSDICLVVALASVALGAAQSITSVSYGPSGSEVALTAGPSYTNSYFGDEFQLFYLVGAASGSNNLKIVRNTDTDPTMVLASWWNDVSALTGAVLTSGINTSSVQPSINISTTTGHTVAAMGFYDYDATPDGTASGGATERFESAIGVYVTGYTVDKTAASSSETIGLENLGGGKAVDIWGFSMSPAVVDPTPRPLADISVTGWTSTGASIAAVIDEASADDADYATSPTITGTGAKAIVSLTNGPLAAGAWAPRVRAKVDSGTATMRVSLLNDSNAAQGYTDVTVNSTITTYNPTVVTTGSSTRMAIEFFS